MGQSESHYASLSKEELLRLVEEKEEEIRLTRVFADTLSEADVSQDSVLQWRGRHRFLAEKVRPVRLKPVASLSLDPDANDNLIIDGDNLPVMYSLLKDYRGRVDVLYLDPPYNTGEDAFPYNDNYLISKAEVNRRRKETGRAAEVVSLDDPNRHTKWINHMAPRLWVARKLLAPTGVLIVSIDEHELPRLWMLMEEIFGAKNRLATLIWERSRKNDAKYFSEGHEYMLVWGKNVDELDSVVKRLGKWRETKPGLEQHLAEFQRLVEMYGDGHQAISEGLKKSVKGIKKTDGRWTIRQYVGVDARSRESGPYKEEDPSWPGGGGPDYQIVHPETGKPVRTPPKGWIVATPEEFYALEADGKVAWKAQGTPKIKKYLLGDNRENDVVTSVIPKDARGAVMLSKALFGFEDAYQHPKDHQLLHRLFNLVTWNGKVRKPSEDIIVLDPYAGSGTTAHAVLAMNAEDGRRRRFILIEGGYVSKKSRVKSGEYTDRYTAERVRKLVTGKWADGKVHQQYDSGFTFLKADVKGITKGDILSADRETLADIILQVAEEESNRIDCRIGNHRYLIGRTRSGLGIALVWEPGKKGQMLDMDILKSVLREAETEGCSRPLHIYAACNAAPAADDIYRFHQIPDAILARLGIQGWDDNGEDA